MNDFVLDASATFSWFFDDESSAAALEVERRAVAGTVHVPALWHWEVANGLALAELRSRIAAEDGARFLTLLREWTMIVDPPDLDRALTITLALARSHSLTSYDASYLELAQRLGLPLATVDRELIIAARAAGVEILGEET